MSSSYYYGDKDRRTTFSGGERPDRPADPDPDRSKFPPPRFIPSRLWGSGDSLADNPCSSAPAAPTPPRMIPSSSDYRRRPDSFTPQMNAAYSGYKDDQQVKNDAARAYRQEVSRIGGNSKFVPRNSEDLAQPANKVANLANTEGVARDAFQQRYPYAQQSYQAWQGHEEQIGNGHRHAQKLRQKAKQHRNSGGRG